MKKLLLLLFAFALFTGCDKDLIEEEAINESFEAKKGKDKKDKDHKVWVCHLNKDGSYKLMHISENALQAHLNHGDMGDVVWEDGFEDNLDSWFVWLGTAPYGHIDRVPSGTNSITSSAGSYHAMAEGNGTVNHTGPFTRFDDLVAKDTWPGDYRTSLDIYLDPNWDTSQGFDYSVSINNTSGSHLQDMVFHVNKDASTGKLLVGGSNNSSHGPNENIEADPHYEVTIAGWYTFQHVFYDIGGLLHVDLNLWDSNGNLLFITTRQSPGYDLIPSQVGGLRTGWFVFINVEGGIAIDELSVHRGCAF